MTFFARDCQIDGGAGPQDYAATLREVFRFELSDDEVAQLRLFACVGIIPFTKLRFQPEPDEPMRWPSDV